MRHDDLVRRFSQAVGVEKAESLVDEGLAAAGIEPAETYSSQTVADVCDAIQQASDGYLALVANEIKVYEQASRRFEGLLERISDPAVVVEFDDRDPVVRTMNPAFQAAFGYGASAVGESLNDLIAPGDAGEVTDQWLHAGGNDGQEVRRRSADGEERTYIFRSVVLTREAGAVEGFGIYTDITEQKRREEALETKAAIMETALDGLAIFDDGDLVEVNDAYADIYGYDDPAALIGTAWRTLFVADDVERMRERIRPTLEDRGFWRGDATGVRADGSTFPKELSLTRRENGQVIAVVRDVSDRVAREEELRRQNDRLEFLNSLLRHDVLNGMAVIQGNAEFLAEELEAGRTVEVDDDVRRWVDTIEAWSDDIVDLVQRVRAMLDVFTGDTVSVTDRVDVVDCLEREVERVRSAHPAVEIDCEFPDRAVVRTDEFLPEVLGNVLSNAVTHNDTDGLGIEVSVESDDDTVTVRVADDGTGVPDELKESIFRRGASGADRPPGSGFGLFFADTMVSEYGGDVRVEDNDPHGAVFVVELPAG